jgi:hypothetical protein
MIQMSNICKICAFYNRADNQCDIDSEIHDISPSLLLCIKSRAEANGIRMVNQQYICHTHHNRYITNWRGQGCIDIQCVVPPNLQAKYALVTCPSRCLPIFHNAPIGSLIHKTCLDSFDTRYNHHLLYVLPKKRTRQHAYILNHNNNDNNNNNQVCSLPLPPHTQSTQSDQDEGEREREGGDVSDSWGTAGLTSWYVCDTAW